MRKLTERCTSVPKLLTIDEACSRYKIGKNYARNIANEVGASVKIGRLLRIDVETMDRYFDSLRGA